jgi:hypothetical protein
VEIDAAISRDLYIRGSDTPEELEGIGSRDNGSVITAIPHFDAVQLSLDRIDHVDTSHGRVGQNCNASRIVDAVHELFHGRGANARRDSISEDMNAAALHCELESGNDKKFRAGEGFAHRDILPHPMFVKHFGVVANRKEAHADVLERSNDSLERFLSIRKNAMGVKYTFVQGHSIARF